ncbi:gastrokine-2-like [Rhinatrema bivittatum]|uniref:gastrokine-2-like n=1 Tax=Rhinatrema bivittatum TaxID=194408 RepID=UPI001129A2EB|nr:gastrokine-2-like [Rhinatrema bivittatum]
MYKRKATPHSSFTSFSVAISFALIQADSAMKTIILVGLLLGIFLTSSSADEAIQIINKGNDGGSVYQTVNINKQVNVAVFNVYSGKQSSNAVFDYNQGIIAYHMPYKGICILARMNRNTFPGLDDFEAMVHNRRAMQKELRALKKHYEITSSVITNLSQFSGAIQGMCWGIPTYWATEYERPRSLIGADGCAGVKFLFLDVGLCGGFHLF